MAVTFMIMVFRSVLLGCALAAVAGCDDFDAAPAAPPGRAIDGGGGRFPGARVPGDDDGAAGHDAGPDADVPGEGLMPLASECFEVDPPSARNGVRTPGDFEVTRAFATWQGTCPTPTLVIGVSEGACPDGSGQELRMELDARDVRDGVIQPNTPLVLRAEPIEQAPRVRFRRPTSLMPSGVWGTCAGVGGDVSFTSLSMQAGTPLRAGGNIGADFAFELTECAAETTQGVVFVNGVLEVELVRGLEEVCPR